MSDHKWNGGVPLRIGVGRRIVQLGEMSTGHERRPSPLGPYAHRNPNIHGTPPGSPNAQSSRRSDSLPDAIPASPKGILKSGASQNLGRSGTASGPLSHSTSRRSASVPDATPASPRSILKGGASRVPIDSAPPAGPTTSQFHARLSEDLGSPRGILKGVSRTWDVTDTPPASPTRENRPGSARMLDNSPPSRTDSAKWTPLKSGVYGTPPRSPTSEKSGRSASQSRELYSIPAQTSPDTSPALGIYGTPPGTPTRRSSLRSSSLPNNHSCSAAEMRPEGTARDGVEAAEGKRAVNALLTTTRLRALSRRLSRKYVRPNRDGVTLGELSMSSSSGKFAIHSAAGSLHAGPSGTAVQRRASQEAAVERALSQNSGGCYRFRDGEDAARSYRSSIQSSESSIDVAPSVDRATCLYGGERPSLGSKLELPKKFDRAASMKRVKSRVYTFKDDPGAKEPPKQPAPMLLWELVPQPLVKTWAPVSTPLALEHDDLLRSLAKSREQHQLKSMRATAEALGMGPESVTTSVMQSLMGQQKRDFVNNREPSRLDRLPINWRVLRTVDARKAPGRPRSSSLDSLRSPLDHELPGPKRMARASADNASKPPIPRPEIRHGGGKRHSQFSRQESLGRGSSVMRFSEFISRQSQLVLVSMFRSAPSKPVAAAAELEPPRDVRRTAFWWNAKGQCEDYSDEPRTKKALINPFTMHRQRWDMGVYCLLYLVAVVTPYEVGYLSTSPSTWWDALAVFNCVADLVFITDTVMNFWLPYRDQNRTYVNNKRTIAMHYLQTWFLVDLVSAFPFDLASQLTALPGAKYLKALRLLRAVRLTKGVGTWWESYQHKVSINYSLMSLMNLFVLLFFLCHWMTCLWGVVVFVLDPSPTSKSWFHYYEYVDPDSPPLRKYVVAFYVCMQTVSGITYGDMTPSTDLEIAYVTLTFLVSGAFYAYIIGAVCNIAESMNLKNHQYYEAVDTLNRWIGHRNLEATHPELVVRLRDFYRFQRAVDTVINQAEILDELTPHLRGRLAFQLNYSWLNECQYFSNVTEDLCVSIALCLHAQPFAPRESIFKATDFVEALFVIERGLVAQQGYIMGRGQIVGQEAFYRNKTQRWQYQAVTLSHGILLVLPSNKLHSILEQKRFAQVKRVLRKTVIKVQMKQLAVHAARVLRHAARIPDYDEAMEYLRMEWGSEKMAALSPHVFAVLLRIRYSKDWIQTLTKAACMVQRHARKSLFMWRARKDAAEQRRKQLLYDCKLELHYVLMPLALEGYVDWLFYEQHIQSLFQLSECTSEELVLAGMPVGHAKLIAAEATRQLNDKYREKVRGIVKFELEAQMEHRNET